eukprot:CCRYP_004449-RA/>CCRYP_004449-RA protein AED:0.03 eAED:0.03 QI:153/1/1/1/1/1/4/361/620
MSSPPRSSTNDGSAITPAASSQARLFASSITSWYLATLDPHAPHTANVESRLRHPVHVVTRRILYGAVEGAQEDLEVAFNDDEAEIKDGPEVLSRRSAARMEAFLASCSVALREEDADIENIEPKARNEGGEVSNGQKKTQGKVTNSETGTLIRARSNSSGKIPKTYRQIDHGDLMHRLELYCRTLRRIRSIMDANPSKEMEECVIQYEGKKTIRSRVFLIIQTYLRNVDCVRDVHKTLMGLISRDTLGVLAVEVCCDELRSAIERLTSEYEHKVSFASLAFLSSPDNSAETHLAPLLTKYFEYLQMNWHSLVSKCELERMLRAVLDKDLRHFFKDAVFHSVGHILDVCRSYRESLDNIALPPPWKEGVFGMAGGGNGSTDMDAAIEKYCSDANLVKQALRDLRREVITVNGQVLSPAHSAMELAENLGRVLNSHQLIFSLSPKGRAMAKKSKKKTAFTSDFGLEIESDFGGSGIDSDGSFRSKIEPGLVDVLTRRLLIAASRTGAGGDAYFIVRDLFGGDEVEVVPHHSQRIDQGTIEIIVKMNAVIIKSHAKFDIIPKPIESDTAVLIQFHTTTTETIALQQKLDSSVTLLKEKKTNMTGWRTLAIRPAYYEKIPSSH